MAIRTTRFDPAEYVRTPEDQADLLNDALDSGDAGHITNALGIIARARGMTEVARGAGVTREALYKSLSPKGDPRLTTLLGALTTLGFKLSARKMMVAEKKPRKRATKVDPKISRLRERRSAIAA
jgi:probable addiction module antidote protein